MTCSSADHPASRMAANRSISVIESPAEAADSQRLRRNSARGAFWPHLVLIVLLFVLALHTTRTFGVFLWHVDDAKWLERTVADARHPWNAFGKPLFGDYYRPVPHLVWLVNYYIWGFNFDGHQLMFLVMWLAAAVLVYLLGRRLGGPLGGLMACTLVGFNGVFLMMASWISWYTTLTELVAVLGWAYCFVNWLRTRERRSLAAFVVLGVVAVLCRELAPLVISACLLVTLVLPFGRTGDRLEREDERATWRKRFVLRLLIWAGVTLVVLALLPAYRGALKSLFAATVSGPAAGERGVSVGYFWPHYVRHSNDICLFGLSPFLLLFAMIACAGQRIQKRRPDVRRYHVLLGAFVLGAVFIGIPWGVAIWDGFGRGSQVAGRYALAGMSVVLFCFFLIMAFTGDRWDRMLGAWFVAGFLPIHFLRMPSGAYHMLAFTALALYVSRWLAVFIRAEGPHLVARLRGRARARREDFARFILVGIFVVVCLGQGYMLQYNFRRAGQDVGRRTAKGRMVVRVIDDAVARVLEDYNPDRPVWIRTGKREHERDWHTLVAGLILLEKHDFTVRDIDRVGRPAVRVQRIPSPLRVYTEVTPSQQLGE